MVKFGNGYEVTECEPELKQRLESSWEGARIGVAKIIPTNFIGPRRFYDTIQALINFKPRPSDVFVCSYLKVGSTWLQEIVWAILSNKNLDHPMLDKDPYHKSPFFEIGALLSLDEIPKALLEKKTVPALEMHNMFPDPRVFKTHLHFGFMHPDVIQKNKVVYVVRDPRDTCLSYWTFARGVVFYGYKHSLAQFANDFINGHAFLGSYIEHLRQWWANRNRKNVYTIYYEEMKKDPAGGIKKLANFLGEDLSEKQVENIIHYTSFNEMKKRDITQSDETARKEFLKEGAEGFYRKGEAGSSENEMTKELRNKIAKHFRQNLGDIKLPYDLSDV